MQFSELQGTNIISSVSCHMLNNPREMSHDGRANYSTVNPRVCYIQILTFAVVKKCESNFGKLAIGYLREKGVSNNVWGILTRDEPSKQLL